MQGKGELSALVAAHARWLTGLVRGLCASEADAEDAFQETWLRLMKSGDGYRGGSVRAYLARIARSVVVDRFRKTGRYALTLDAPGDDGLTTAEKLPDPGETPARRFETAATHADVLAAVRTLPEGPRTVLLMRIEGELSFKEIAAELGVPLGTALTWMRTATVRLKRQLGEKT